MGCSSCGSGTVAQANALNIVNRQYRVQQQAGPCDYTNEILDVWLTKLKWFKDTGLYTKFNVKAGTINKYLGIVLTSINVNNKCNYKTSLDIEIKTLVTFITGLQNV